MSTDATAVLDNQRRRVGLTQALAGLAVVLAAGALAVSLLHAGPRGAQGTAGARGPQGAAGSAADTSYINQLKECVPELTQWINSFNVQTSSNNSGSTYWLTDAYLDTSQQQVAGLCKKVLGLKG